MDDIQIACADAEAELRKAKAAYPRLSASAHEAYGKLAEEFRELETWVFTKEKNRDAPAMRKEAIQVAAMALRFVTDICDAGRADAP